MSPRRSSGRNGTCIDTQLHTALHPSEKEKPQESCEFLGLNPGGLGRNRTIDTRIFNPLLYRLSYLGKPPEIPGRARKDGLFSGPIRRWQAFRGAARTGAVLPLRQAQGEGMRDRARYRIPSS